VKICYPERLLDGMFARTPSQNGKRGGAAFRRVQGREIRASMLSGTGAASGAARTSGAIRQRPPYGSARTAALRRFIIPGSEARRRLRCARTSEREAEFESRPTRAATVGRRRHGKCVRVLAAAVISSARPEPRLTAGRS
jgi:hypothetical protein